VIENKGDFFGTVVNKAARINSAAAPDEIRVSDATKIMLGRADGFVFEDPQEVPLKGLDGEHRIYRLNY
jgi:class 3 adenylate cyclase